MLRSLLEYNRDDCESTRELAIGSTPSDKGRARPCPAAGANRVADREAAAEVEKQEEAAPSAAQAAAADLGAEVVRLEARSPPTPRPTAVRGRRARRSPRRGWQLSAARALRARGEAGLVAAL